MSQQDRSYDRDSDSAGTRPLSWLFASSFPFMDIAGLRIRVHVSLLLVAGLLIVAGGSESFPLAHRLYVAAALLGLVLAHELGHCLGARVIGGYADEVVLWPLGGLSDVQSPHRPLARFFTIVSGLFVTLIIGVAAALSLEGLYGTAVPLWPGDVLSASAWGPSQAGFYLWYIYAISYLLLLVNVLPILPLDGGQVLHAMLWPAAGYGRALVLACDLGMVAAVALGAYAIATAQWLLFLLMLACVLHCVQRRAAVKAVGIATFDQFEQDLRRRPRRHRLSRYMKWRARRQIRLEAADQDRVDEILEKVHRRGVQSLSWRERRVLRRATNRQRERTLELG